MCKFGVYIWASGIKKECFMFSKATSFIFFRFDKFSRMGAITADIVLNTVQNNNIQCIVTGSAI